MSMLLNDLVTHHATLTHLFDCHNPDHPPCSVSLELLEDGTPKPPRDAMDDGLPKLYVSHNGFMKVLGCTLDIDIEKMQPVLYDPSGNEVNPNA